MSTPPSNQPPTVSNSGPAWTRNPKSSKKQRSNPYGTAAGGASSTSSISLLNHASSSSLSLPQQQSEAPYLTHKQRYHGQFTLVAPDNLGGRRPPGFIDAPETRIDARGGFGLPGMEETRDDGNGEEGGGGDDDDEKARKIKKKVKKKKKKEEEQMRQQQIMAAVSNAGRTPSPNSSARVAESSTTPTRETLAQTTAATRPSAYRGTLAVPPTNGATQPRERRSRSRSRAPIITSETRSQAARVTASESQSQPEVPSAPQVSRRARPLGPNPASVSPNPLTSHRRSLSPGYIPPPSLDDPSLDSQLSLGLVDPSILLSPPPPAYVPPPAIPNLPSEPPPPISVPSADSSNQVLPRPSGPSTVNSDDEEEEEEEDATGPPDPLVLAWEEDRLTGLYSLDERIARDMERRRAAEEVLLSSHGLAQDVGETISESREEEEEAEIPGQGEDDLNEIRQAEASRDNRRLSRALSRHASRRYGAGSRRSTLLFGSTSNLGALRETRTLEEASELGSHSPSPVPSPNPDPSPPRPSDSSPLPTLVEPSASSSPFSIPRSPRIDLNTAFLGTDDEPSGSVPPPPLMSPAESSAVAAEFPSPSPSQLSPSLSNSPYISDTEDDRPEPSSSEQGPLSRTLSIGEEEVEEESANKIELGAEEEEDDEVALARRVTSNGRGLAALAAERRLRLEKERKEKAEKRTRVEPVLEVEDEDESTKVGEGEEETAQSPPQSPRPQASRQTISTSEIPASTTLQRRPSSPDHELSFSRPSSRSSQPRPAPLPQLHPLEPAPAFLPPTASVSAPAPTASSGPPPVPARRSVGRRSLDELLPSQASTSSPSRSTGGRRQPPPPPPPREVGHRSSVRSIAAALESSRPNTALPLRPRTSPSRTSVGSVTRHESTGNGRTGSTSEHFSTSAERSPSPDAQLGPPSGSSEQLDATRPLSLSASLNNGANESSSRRHRPLPIPPAPLSQDRIDAFTALRAVQGILSPTEETSISSRSLPQPSAVTALSATNTVATPLRPALQPRLSTSSSSSSLENPGPPLPRRPPTQPTSDQLSAYTDLDLLLARLEVETASVGEDGGEGVERQGRVAAGAEGEDGRNYDDLLTLGEIMGNVAPAGASPEEIAEHLTVARVELERRRIDKRGKVKTKLSVVGVRCVDCSICMSRFKVDDFAVVLSNCLHIFHEKCIRTWFHRSRQCPVCRAQVFPPRPLVDLTAP